MTATGRSFPKPCGRTGSTEITRQEDTSYTTNSLTWNYDKMYRLVSEFRGQGSEDQVSDSYSYDLVGNRLQKSSAGILPAVVDYSYNANDQLLQETSVSPAPPFGSAQGLSLSNGSAVTSYSYDANGSLTNQVKVAGTGPEATAYAYDLENRLSGATIYRLEGTNIVEISASYLYNPSGIRVRSDSQTRINQLPITPVTNHKFFLVDSMNHTGYAQVLEESSSTASGSSTLDRSYTIGDDVLAQSDGTSTPATHYLGYDGHGSTRILTDGNVAIASGARYSYDAYGVQLGTQSSVVSPALTSLLYTGELFDTGLGQYYLRARYYSQITGRFNQLDPFAGNDHDPQSLHKYLYAHDDPANGTDPSGENFDLKSLVASTAVVSILARMTLGAIAGGVFGGLDAFFAGQDVQEGIIVGATVGMIATPALAVAIEVKLLRPFLIALGAVASFFSIVSALQDDDYDLAVYRTIVSIGPLALLGAINRATVGTRLGILSGNKNNWLSSGGLRYTTDKTYGNKVLHVLNHSMNDRSRDVHGVFTVGRSRILGLLDEAYLKIKAAPDTYWNPVNRSFEIKMPNIIGYEGGLMGSGKPTQWLRLVPRSKDSNEVVTAYPIIK